MEQALEHSHLLSKGQREWEELDNVSSIVVFIEISLMQDRESTVHDQ